MSVELAEQIVDLIRRVYPDWDGFAHPSFTEDEISYKRAAATEAGQLLAEEQLHELLESGQHSEILERVKRLARSTNLLYQGTPSSGDLAALYAPALAEESLCRAAEDLLYGPGPSTDRLDRFARSIDEQGLPNKWTLPTYLLFLRFPDTDFFVKPSVTRWFLRLVGEPDLYTPRPNGETYARILEHARTLRVELEQYGARDMIDVQSALYVGHAVIRDGRNLRPSDAKRREMESLFEDFVRDFLETEEGRAHNAGYETSRAAARKSFQEIVAARDAGEDVTDRILLELLPHTDSERHRKTGAWISIAPAIMGNVKSFFEAAGWQDPETWSEVAGAILEFVERCTVSPSELDAACTDFAKQRWSTGFQTGMLSPVLNALRPDDFLLVNNKSRRLINYLSGQSFGQKLTDYPAINWAGKVVIESLADVLESSPAETRIEDLFDAFSHWLVSIRRFTFGKAQYWKVAPGEGAKYWDQCLEGGFISIGWNELGDLSKVSRDEFERRRDRLLTENPDWAPDRLEQVWKFAKIIREGDRIVANEGTGKVLGFGTVTGPYEFVEPRDPAGRQSVVAHAHRLPMDWDDTTPRQIDEGGWRRTLVTLDREKYKFLLQAPPADPTVRDQESAPTITEAHPPYPLEDCASDLRMDLEDLERWVRAIQRKRQAILFGPPGTGKTYVADHLADHLVGSGDGFKELVQFHPSYAYEDFIQGIRPQPLPEGGLDYPLRRGRFLDFCDRARDRQGLCVLIVDEINRADLSRVFGELMYLLEYRDQSVRLAAGGETFSIPDNVRILGTMNTADRSIALVDHALRRRFAFLHLGPSYETLRRFHEGKGYGVEALIRLLQEVNDAIDDPHYLVGITFFLTDDLPDHLEDIWRMEILPYLEEYFYSQRETVERFRWQTVRKQLDL